MRRVKRRALPADRIAALLHGLDLDRGLLGFALPNLLLAIWNAADGNVGTALVQLFFFALAASAARYVRRHQC